MKRFRELKETLDVPTFSPETLAKKHGVSLETIEAQLKAGIAVEKEHTSDPATAREIALDHLGEKPDYYAKLDKANLEESTWEGYRLEALLESRYEDAMMSRLPAHLDDPREPKAKKKKKFVPDPKVWKKMPGLGKLLGVKLEEARLHHVLKGHPYHHKSDAELHYIIKDAAEAEKAIGTHDKKAMWKYGDQQNDAASILGYRKRGGKQIPEPKRVYTEEHHAPGTIVKFPHKGQMKSGKVVRYIPGSLHDGSPSYVIYHGEYESARVPHHKVVAGKLEEADLKAQWKQDASKDSYSRRSNLRRTIKQQMVPKTPGLGNKAWLRADKEDKASRSSTYQVREDAEQLEEASSPGMSLQQAVAHAKQHGHRITYGTNSRKWHTIDSTDRDFKNGFSYDPHDDAAVKHAAKFWDPKAKLEEGSRDTTAYSATPAERRRMGTMPTFKSYYAAKKIQDAKNTANKKFTASLRQSDLKEALTPRERVSGAERLKPIEPAPLDHAQDQKKALAHHDNTNDSMRKNLSQGGIDSSAHKTVHHGTASAPLKLKEGSDLPFYKYTNDELDAAIKHHADAATELRRFDRKSHAAYQHIQHAHAAREILKSRKRNLRNYGMDEAYDMAFNESDAADHLAQFSHHWAQFKLHDNLSDTDRTHLTKRNHHEREMNKHYKNLTTQQKNALRLTESVESYKVGDKVVAKIGPHKGTVHTVIHVHDTGHVNIKPDVHVRSNRYHLGAARAHPNDLERAPLEEASTRRSFYQDKQRSNPAKWLKNRGKQFKHWPDEAKTTNVSPFSGVNRKTIQEIFQAAKDKKNGTPPKQDALPNDGANEPNKEVPGAPGIQPQDAKGPQDGAPGAEQKKNNAPKPENPNSKKLQVKGPGPEDKFQTDPIVTPLSTMPDTASPKSGSQGVR